MISVCTIQYSYIVHNDLQPAGYAKHPTLITAITLTLTLTLAR